MKTFATCCLVAFVWAFGLAQMIPPAQPLIGLNFLPPPPPKTNITFTLPVQDVVIESSGDLANWKVAGWAVATFSVSNSEPQQFYRLARVRTISWAETDARAFGFKVYFGSATNDPAAQAVDVGRTLSIRTITSAAVCWITCYDQSGAESAGSEILKL